jgi:hypothetical protein
MYKRKLSTGLALGIGLTAAALSMGATAEAISGKKNLVCAAAAVVGCTEGSCMQGRAQTFELPTFMFINAERRHVHANNEKGEEFSSPIKSFEITENTISLQGFENHRGWTIGINRDDGEMAMSSTGADVSFLVFGNCIEH